MEGSTVGNFGTQESLGCTVYFCTLQVANEHPAGKRLVAQPAEVAKVLVATTLGPPFWFIKRQTNVSENPEDIARDLHLS
eukprot:6335551-Pyramimonas_sp.AAC.1